MSIDYEERYNPAKSCGELVEALAERFDHTDGRGINVAEMRGVVKRAIARGVLTLPKYTHSPDEIIRRINLAKEQERYRQNRLANPPKPRAIHHARAECLALGNDYKGKIAAIARKHGVNPTSLQEWHRDHIRAEKAKRLAHLMTCKAY